MMPFDMHPAPDPVHVIGQKHPFSDGIVRCEVSPGMTISEIMGNPAPHVFVLLEGRLVPRDRWAWVRPKPGSHLEVKLLASDGGGDGNKVLRTVLMIAVAAAAIYTGNLWAVNGQWGVASVVAATTVTAIGNLVVNNLVPPQLPQPPTLNSAAQSSFNRKYSLTGTRNQAIPYGVVPQVLGRHRFYPPFAAKPYTETVGEEQYLRVLLVLGYGPMDVPDSEIRIGQTPISEYDDVEYEISESPALFTNDVDEEQLSLVYDGADGIGVSNTRTSVIDADELSVDFVFPQGLWAMNDNGDTTAAVVYLRVEYRLAGSEDPWLNVTQNSTVQYVTGAASGLGFMKPHGTESPTIRISGAKRETRRCGVRWKVPRGQYEIRVTKTAHETPGHDDIADDRIYRECVWAVLRSVTYKLPIHIPGVILFAARIKATDQLQGVTDRINMVVERHLPVWNGSAWVTQKTRNPAWAVVDALCGPANGRPKDRDKHIDKAEFLAWAQDNELYGRYFDAVIDAPTTVGAVVRDAAACGRATPAKRMGKDTVVREIPQTACVQVFTPRNSWGFRGQRSFHKPLHAVRVFWTNPELDWQRDETLVFADGYDKENASEIGTLELRGVTDYAQAWRSGLYYLLATEARRESFSFYADWENLVCRRGSKIRVAHDVLDIGLRSARIKSVVLNEGGSVVRVILDEKVEMLADRSYTLLVRHPNNDQAIHPIRTVPGETNELELTAAVPQGMIDVDDLVVFGHPGQESIDVIVKNIRRGKDHTAQLEVVPYAEELHEVDTRTPPEYIPDPSAIIDTAIARCCPPVVEVAGSSGSSIRSDQSVATRATGGIKIPGISLRVVHQEEP